MRYYFSLFVVFAVGALVLAAPPDKRPTMKKEDVQCGQIHWPRLKFVKPKDPSVQNKHAQWHHPVVVVSDVDADNKVKVAPISRGQPAHWGSTVEPASNYADLDGHINVGPPKTVHIEHLGRNNLDGTRVIRAGRLQPLIDRINANSPADQQLPACAEPPPGSARGNRVHGRPELDHSKQSSQQSSSNTGSSSQVSRPGSPKQSSQQSSSNKASSSQGSWPGSPKQSSQEGSSSQGPQGSQLGGSKQGSPPGSSDDGWQVMTGRRRNKAWGSRNQ